MLPLSPLLSLSLSPSEFFFIAIGWMDSVTPVCPTLGPVKTHPLSRSHGEETEAAGGNSGGDEERETDTNTQTQHNTNTTQTQDKPGNQTRQNKHVETKQKKRNRN